MPRPDAATYDKVASYLDRARPRPRKANPGDLPNLHRLTRTEYSNAIRDLLAVDDLPKEMDFTAAAPADNASSGFDNIADLLYVSPATMERYLDAATKISRLAVGDPQMPLMVTSTASAGRSAGCAGEDLPQNARWHSHSQLLPADGEYDINVELAGAARDTHQLRSASMASVRNW
jgi:hypothetical protein